MKYVCSIFAIFFITPVCLAHDEVVASDALQVEQATHKDTPVFCQKEFKEPKQSDFIIKDYNVMSSETGLRYALMSIQNTANGQRILTQENLLAVFANCKARQPFTFKEKLAGGEVITKTVFFGKNQFPIIKVVSDVSDITEP